MSSPLETEVQSILQNVVDALETHRAYADDTMVNQGGTFDVLVQSIEGLYTQDILAAMNQFRASLASPVSTGSVQSMIDPVLFEYGRLITDYGGGFRDAKGLAKALYDWFHTNSYTVQSRAITYDTTPTPGGSNVGGGHATDQELGRLTVDANGYNLEGCTVEKKIFRCIRDKNTGTNEGQEIFSVLGAAESPDALGRATAGSGVRGSRTIVCKHAGSASGGSMLTNSSFQTYGASATPKFQGWTETAGGANISQDTSNYYRLAPLQTTGASLSITGGAGDVTLTQTKANMRIGTFRPDVPYFLRAMVNKDIGSAAGGLFTLSLGGSSVAVDVDSLGSNWQEVKIAFTSDCWLKNFNTGSLSVVLDWSGTTSGTLKVDDVILCPWDKIDGTYYVIRLNHESATSWLVDDELSITDTGGAPSTGKIQYWLWAADRHYLPSSGTPTLADPS